MTQYSFSEAKHDFIITINEYLNDLVIIAPLIACLIVVLYQAFTLVKLV